MQPPLTLLPCFARPQVAVLATGLTAARAEDVHSTLLSWLAMGIADQQEEMQQQQQQQATANGGMPSQRSTPQGGGPNGGAPSAAAPAAAAAAPKCGEGKRGLGLQKWPGWPLVLELMASGSAGTEGCNESRKAAQV